MKASVKNQDQHQNENIKAYAEACNTIRHYSTCSFNVRALTIVQGVALLSVGIVEYKELSFSLLLCLSLLGCFFTILLFNFHKGYFKAIGFFYDKASKMEEILFDKDFRPIQLYNNEHKKKYKTTYSQFSILYAPFVFTGTPFIILFSISLFNLCLCK